MLSRVSWPTVVLLVACLTAWVVLVVTKQIGAAAFLAGVVTNGALAGFPGLAKPAGARTTPSVPPLPLLLAALAVFALLVGCSGSGPGVPTTADKEAYGWNSSTCLISTVNLAEARECLRSVRADYCARYPTLDSCPKDAGHE